MFSKALFKQSCKANGTMWSVITFAVCFMLACVMLISGNGNIGEVKNSIQDTIIVKEIDSQMEEKALSYYSDAVDGMEKFDSVFASNAGDTLSYLFWFSKMPNKTEFENVSEYAAAAEAWQNSAPETVSEAGKEYAEKINEWSAQMPIRENFSEISEYSAAISEWQEKSPATQENAVAVAYSFACDELKEYLCQKAKDKGYSSGSTEENEILGSVMYSLNPNGAFDGFYEENGETAPEDYDILSIISHIGEGDVNAYIVSDERRDYTASRAEEGTAVFLAGNMTKEETVNELLDALSNYGVTKEKFDSFGYTYDSVKHMAKTAVVTYRSRTDYEISLLSEKYKDGEFGSEEEYLNAVANKKSSLADDISSSFLSTLPNEVSDALEEIGQADLYTLIVGSIFYKLAGLLLPIIYMIMASNNLISGQVDSGSLAYVLSTSTKRITVVFTQAVYLVGSLLATFALTTLTGCICLPLVTEDVELTVSNLILLNVGAFLVLFALSGLCFFTSCVFDRSKHSMAIGGGLSVFALVAAMLGLFGSPVIPSVIRLDALNYFNRVTVISFFDVISVIDGTDAFIWKFAVLGVLGIIGYVIGSIRFIKKDLPL